jgi:serine/threonine protein kinase
MSDLVAGRRLGDYVIGRVLGEGGMGTVYLATRGEHTLVLKIMKSELAQDLAQRRRFEREARIAREIDHPALVPILDAGERDGFLYVTMPFVGLRTLRERIAEIGQLPVRETLRVARVLGEGLDVLHERGIIHRDVKPSNVILDDETGRPHLSDFGIAKGLGYTALTRTGQVVGTLDYLAPELIRGEDASVSSDVYAMGCLLYECIVGQPPYADRPFFQIGFGHLQEPPPDPRVLRPALAEDLASTLLRGLEKDPGRRPKSAGAYARLLQVVAKVAGATAD